MATKPKFDPRKMMEKAVEAMKQFVNEPRDDGKASPRVGAVLVKPDGSIDTAFRGELRHGERPRDPLQGAAPMNCNPDVHPDMLSRSRFPSMPWVRIPTEIPTKCRDSSDGYPQSLSPYFSHAILSPSQLRHWQLPVSQLA